LHTFKITFGALSPRKPLVKLGLNIGDGGDNLIPSRDELNDLYWGKKLTTAEIAKLKGVHRRTVSKWLKKLGIRARSQSEAFEIYFAKHEHWNKGKGIRIHPDLHMSTNLAYVLGVLKGDGWVSDVKSSWRIVLNQTREAFARSFEKALRNTGLNARTTVLRHKGLYVTRASSAEFAKWYKSLGLNQIEEMVLAKRDYEIAFIRGFYESDGSNVIGKKGPRGGFRWSLQIVCKDYKLISMVQRILDRLGYNFALYSRSERELYLLQSWRKEENFIFLKEIQPCIKNSLPD